MLKYYQYVDCWELLEDIFGIKIGEEPQSSWDTPFQEMSPYEQFKKHLFSHEGGQDSLVDIDFVESEATFKETGLTFSGPEKRDVTHKQCEHLKYPEYNRAMYEWCTEETYNTVMQWAKDFNIKELTVKIWW